MNLHTLRHYHLKVACLPIPPYAPDLNNKPSGGAARKLWEQLPRFTEINYAIPLSFTTVNLDKWSSLDADTRGALAEAAAETEARQWQALEGRLEQNYKRMREQGMTIDTSVPRALRERMREAARATVEAWAATVGPEGEALVATLRKDR